MIKEINFWRNLCLKKNIKFEVKPHPRNDKNDFNELKNKINFEYDFSHKNSDIIVVGMSSTYILECHNAGHKVLITRTCNFFKKVSNMFYSLEFPIVHDYEEANYYLDNLHLCKIINFEKNFTFGIDKLNNHIKSLL